jgi:WD40 repeat protein
MTSHAALLLPGEHEKPGVVPGKPAESDLITQITVKDGKAKMPRQRPPLPDYDIRLIAKWIEQGAKDDTPTSAREVVVDPKHPPIYQLPPVITGLDYSPDGKLLAVSGYHEVLLHNADGSGVAARLVGLSERVQSVAFSPDGKLLAVAGGAPGRFGELQIWDVAKRKLRLSHPVTYDTLFGLSWAPDGSKIAFGCTDNTLRAIEVDTGEQVLYQGAHDDWVLGTAFSSDGTFLASVSRDRSMKLTEVATQRFNDNITSITPGALKGGLMTVDRRPMLVRTMAKVPPDTPKAEPKIYDELLIGGSDGTPRIYKMHREVKRVIGDDANKVREFEAMPGRIFCARFNRDGTRFVAASSSEGKGEVRVYRVAPALPPQNMLRLNALPVTAGFGLSPVLFMNEYRTGPRVSTFQGQKGPVYAAAFSADGQEVATGGFDGVVRINDVLTGKLIREFVPVPMK